MPSEPELAARYGVTRATVNRAMSILRAEGLVRPERGETPVNQLPVIRREAQAAPGHPRGRAGAGRVRRRTAPPRADRPIRRRSRPGSRARRSRRTARRRRRHRRPVPAAPHVRQRRPRADGHVLPAAGYRRGHSTGQHRPRPRRHLLPAGRPRARTGHLHRDGTRAPARRRRDPVPAHGPDQRVVAIQRTARTAPGRIVEVNDITLQHTNGSWSTNGPPTKASQQIGNAVLQLPPLPMTRSPDAADELADVAASLYQRNWHSGERPAKV